MKTAVDVRMKAEYIYDLLLFHTYSKFSGFMINLMGLMVIVMGGLGLGTGKISMAQCLVYLVAGTIFLALTPLNLRLRSKKMIKDPKYRDTLHYSFDKQGIEEEVQGKVNTYSWDNVQKAIATPKNIAFYVNEESALIIPKEYFGQNFMPVMKLIVENVTRDRIYIR